MLPNLAPRIAFFAGRSRKLGLRELRYLTTVVVETETDGLDDANCKTRCVAEECAYYWEGRSCKLVYTLETFATSTFLLCWKREESACGLCFHAG